MISKKIRLIFKRVLLPGSSLFTFIFFLLIFHQANALKQFDRQESIHPAIVNHSLENNYLILPPIASIFQDSIYTEVDQEAEFRGGPKRWTQHIQEILTQSIREFEREDFGECRVKFVVDVKGKISNFSILTMRGTKLSDAVETAILKGPKWEPALKDGIKVKSYKEVSVKMQNPR